MRYRKILASRSRSMKESANQIRPHRDGSRPVSGSSRRLLSRRRSASKDVTGGTNPPGIDYAYTPFLRAFAASRLALRRSPR